MPRNDATVAVHQNRVVEAKLSDRPGDQRQLRLTLGPRVVGIWDESIDRLLLDRLRAGVLVLYCSFSLPTGQGEPPFRINRAF